MVARVPLPVVVPHDGVPSRAEALPGVFEQDPIYPPWSEAGVRILVARSSEAVEGVRVSPFLVSGGEVGVHETALHKVSVRGGSGPAVEVPREDDRCVLSVMGQELRYLAEDQPAALSARHCLRGRGACSGAVRTGPFQKTRSTPSSRSGRPASPSSRSTSPAPRSTRNRPRRADGGVPRRRRWR